MLLFMKSNITMYSNNNHNIDTKIPLCLSFSNVDVYIIEENEYYQIEN